MSKLPPTPADEILDHGCRILNGPSRLMNNLAADEFIQRICQELSNGYGFVPLVGAGFSAPSGIPLIHQVRRYLQRCICFALGAEEPGMRPWNPRNDNWPPFIDSRRPEASRYHWEDLVYSHFNRIRLREPENPNLSVLQEGYGAMAEWRTALLFLSRLVRESDAPKSLYSGRLMLGLPRQEIIDACFREVMRGKHPSLNHHMLSALSGLLRIDVVLSTNFDDLLERAFSASRNALEVFEVHLEGALPNWATISRVRALVKLHGSKQLLRADYSLDGEPTDSDKKHFLQYLIGGELDEANFQDPAASTISQHGGLSPAANHLLVMGVGATERRTCAFIQHAWENLSNFKVYWICHTETDVENVTKLTEACRLRSQHLRDEATGTEPWSIVLRHTDIGLLLLQLYQIIRRNIPPFGTVFPSVSRIAQPPLPTLTAILAGQTSEQTTVTKLKSVLESFEHPGFASPEFTKYRIVTVSSQTKVRGLTAECASVFRELEHNHVCLWIDMNDISSTDNLFEVMLETAFLKLGLENWTPVFMGGEARSRAREMRRLVASSSFPWVVFLNARETPGENTADTANADQESNGWLDRTAEPESRDDSKDKSAWMGPFVELLAELCGTHERGISVVLLCYGDPPVIAKKLDESFHIGGPLMLRSSAAVMGAPETVEKVTDESIAWTIGHNETSGCIEKVTTSNSHELIPSEVRARQSFLHSIILFQRSRLAATIWNDCMRPAQKAENDASYDDEKAKWLDQLECIGLLRRKPGGYIWVHSRCRSRIREILQCSDRISDVYKSKGVEPHKALCLAIEWAPQTKEHLSHVRIAEWYQKVLVATGSPAAAFEAAEHLCRAAEAILHWGSEKQLDDARACIAKAAAIVRRNGYLIQTHGYSRGSCRRLEYLRDFMTEEHLRTRADQAWTVSMFLDALGPQIRALKRVCAEVMRAIAREVGEDAKAYQRHRELRELMIGSKSNKLTSRELAKHLQDRLDKARNANSSEDVEEGASRIRQEWLRYWRWCGMLGIASRSDQAESALAKALHVAMRFSRICSDSEAEELWHGSDQKARSLDAVLDEDGFQSLAEPAFLSRREQVEILRIMEESASYLLLEEYAVQRFKQFPGERQKWHLPSVTGDQARRKVDKEGSELRRRLEKGDRMQMVKKLIEVGLQLAQFTTAQDDRGSSYHTMVAMWCKSRLLLHKSSAETSALPSGIQGSSSKFDASMSILGDAELCLGLADQRRMRSEKAMVDLHRANCRLVQANELPISSFKCECNHSNLEESEIKHGVSFRKICLHLLRSEVKLPALSGDYLSKVDPNHDPLGHQRVFLRDAHFQVNDHTLLLELRRIKSLSYDAMRFLDRAEPVLRERRRNVWWTTWYFEKRLRTIATLVWASTLEVGSPIPFLGLEAAMRKTDTEADVLLDDAIRMIRVDAYRLATVVHAYALCVKALQLRLLWDPTSPALPDRLSTMRLNLQRGLSALEEVRRRRTVLNVKEMRQPALEEEKYKLGIVSQAFVDEVLWECNRVAEDLSSSISPVA
jgi:hypothetical protein